MSQVYINRRGEERLAVNAISVESFTTPGLHYTVNLYRDESGKVAGGSCSCPARVEPLADKHVLYAIAESYGQRPPKVGSFVTQDFLEELSELTGIAYFELSSAFTGERKIVAKAVVAAALTFGSDPKEWGGYIRSWGKRFGRGKYHRAYNSEGAA